MDALKSLQEQLKAPLHILLVEDETLFSEFVAKVLERRGLKVTRVENGMDAAKIFAHSHWRYDLVISDVNMPELTGDDFLKFVRERSNIPFIAMTGAIGVMTTAQVFSLGATEFLQKPFLPADLFDAISRSLYCRIPEIR